MSPLFDILIFVVIAAFLLFRLKNVLGEYNEDDDAPKDKEEGEKNKAPYTIVVEKTEEIKPKMKKRKGAPEWPSDLPDFSVVTDATTHNRLLKLHEQNADFNPQQFLSGSMRAYDMILDAFENKDRATLEMLLTKKMLKKAENKLSEGGITTQSGDVYSPEAQEALISDVKMGKSDAKLIVDFWSADASTSKIAGEYDKRAMFHDRWVFTQKTDETSDIWLLDDIIPMEDA